MKNVSNLATPFPKKHQKPFCKFDLGFFSGDVPCIKITLCHSFFAMPGSPEVAQRSTRVTYGVMDHPVALKWPPTVILPGLVWFKTDITKWLADRSRSSWSRQSAISWTTMTPFSSIKFSLQRSAKTFDGRSIAKIFFEEVCKYYMSSKMLANGGPDLLAWKTIKLFIGSKVLRMTAWLLVASAILVNTGLIF